MRRFPQTWCEVSVEALRHNARTLRTRLRPGSGLGVVVKAEAYGHGLDLVTLALEDLVEVFVVHTVDEGLRVRSLVDKRVVLVGAATPAGLEAAVRAGLEPTLTHRDALPPLAAAAAAEGREARVHLKLETGTNRQGMLPDDLLSLARSISATEGVEVAGISTHFADIEDTLDHSYARSQFQSFSEIGQALAASGLGGVELHCANSAATLLWPETHGAFVRAGISAYGLWPSRETWLSTILASSGSDTPELRPAMTWVAELSQVKDVPSGSFVGYGRTHRTTSRSQLGVVAVGYADGYDRRLSNRAHMLLRGRRVPVVGRVCMNLSMVDVSDVPDAAPGDRAVLLGPSGDERLSSEDLAGWIGTINYEVPTRVALDLPRVAVDVPEELREKLSRGGVPLTPPLA
jgi:alanine racemase